MPSGDRKFGWRGPAEARQAWALMRHRFQPFALTGPTVTPTRTCAWDAWKTLGFDINQSILYEQQTGDCLAADTIVDGPQPKRICDIKVGDSVTASDGTQTTVISTAVKKVSKPLVEVKVRGGLPIKTTEDHCFLVYRIPTVEGKTVTRARYEQSHSTKVAAAFETRHAQWTTAGELRPGDLVLEPAHYALPKRDGVDLGLDHFLLGYFAGNGYAANGSVEIATPTDDVARWLEAAFQNAGYRPRTTGYVSDRDCLRVRVHSKSLADVLRKWFYSEDGSKKFPEQYIGDLNFVNGLLAADGFKANGRNYFDSTSLSLVRGVNISLIHAGYEPRISEMFRSNGTYPNAKPLYRVTWFKTRRGEIWRDDSFICKRVAEVKYIEGPHEVYDIGVAHKDHAFVANGHIVHNCVSFGAAIAIAAVAAWEIVRCRQIEGFKVPFPPWLYGISRLMPEGGNGRLGREAGSLGVWMADTVVKYGVLRRDYQGVPAYSGTVADGWGYSKSNLSPFFTESAEHLIKRTARLRDVQSIVDAVCNGYFVTIASMRGYSMALKDDRGKSWFQGTDQWPHQMSFLSFDTQPEWCLYRRNQWGRAHGKQLDGPDGGGWVTCESLEREVASSDTEVFAYSLFDGWPSERAKPENYFA